MNDATSLATCNAGFTFPAENYPYQHPLVFIDKPAALRIHRAIHGGAGHVALFDHITKCRVQVPVLMTHNVGLRYVTVNGSTTFIEQGPPDNGSTTSQSSSPSASPPLASVSPPLASTEGGAPEHHHHAGSADRCARETTWIISGVGIASWGRIVDGVLDKDTPVLNRAFYTDNNVATNPVLDLDEQRRQTLEEKMEENRKQRQMERGDAAGHGAGAHRSLQQQQQKCEQEKKEMDALSEQCMAHFASNDSPIQEHVVSAQDIQGTINNAAPASKPAKDVKRYGRPVGVIQSQRRQMQGREPLNDIDEATQESNATDDEIDEVESYDDTGSDATDNTSPTYDTDDVSDAVSITERSSDIHTLDEERQQYQWNRKVNFVKIIDSAMQQQNFAWPFVSDPKSIPGYGQVFPREQQIWLGRMMRRANNLEYDTAADLMRDMDVLVSNCVRFNGEDSPFSEMADRLSSYVSKLIEQDFSAPIESNNDKRRKGRGTYSQRKMRITRSTFR